MSAIDFITTPAKHDILITRGDSFLLEVWIRDQLTQAAIALDGLSGVATIRPSLDYPSPSSLTVVVSQTTSGLLVGKISVSATGAATTIFPQAGVWDLTLTDGSSTRVLRKTLLVGAVEVVRGVS